MATNGAEAHTLLDQAGPFRGKVMLQESHERADFLCRTVPIFLRKRINGQSMDAEFQQRVIISLTELMPSRWPAMRGRPRSSAHRPLPSIMTATCFGSSSGSNLEVNSLSDRWSKLEVWWCAIRA